MRGLSPGCHDLLPPPSDDGFVRVSALWSVGAATVLAAGSVGWAAVAAPMPSSRILGQAVIVPQNPGPQAVPTAGPSRTIGGSDAGDDAGDEPSAGSAPPAGSGGTSSAAIGARATAANTNGGDEPSLLGQPWSSTSHGVVPPTGAAGSGSAASSTSSSWHAAPATQPTSASSPASATTSPSTSAPHTVTVTRVRTLSDDSDDDHEDHEDGHEKDEKEAHSGDGD